MKSFELNWYNISRYRTEIMGFMCILVVLFHFRNALLYAAFLKPIKLFVEFGNIGVDIFLFVSGIGLYFSFVKSPKIIHFYVKRLIRIIIPYILLCVPYYVWLNLATERDFLILDLTQLSLPLKNMITTWYLPTTAVFYLLFPILFYLQKRKNNFLRLFVTGAICALWIFAMILMSRSHLATIYKNCEIALLRFPIFIVGCCFGKFVHEKHSIPAWILIPATAYIAIYPFIYYKFGFTIFRERISYIPLAIAISIVISFLFSLLPSNNPLFHFLRFFGVRSLEIYITHVLINNVWIKTLGTNKYFDSNGTIDAIIIIILSILISIIAHIIIEKISNLLLKN